MSFFSLSDIFSALQFALQLREAFFLRVNRAELRYKEFGDEIGSLEKSLKKLSEVFEITIREREQRIFHPDYKSLDETAERERKALVGDFNETLERCRELLSENAKFLTKSGGVWDNAKWHFKTQAVVDALRTRLQFHTAKITLLLQPLKCQLLNEISVNVWEIRHDVRALREEVRQLANFSTRPSSFVPYHALPPVPPELEALFLEAIEVRKPSTYTDISAFPLREGLDALIAHFRESTVKYLDSDNFGGCGQPTVQQLLNLIKARWVLGKLKDSIHLREAGINSLWARCLGTLETKVLDQFRRPAVGYDVCARESSNISQLEKENFTIWITNEPLQAPRTITDEDIGEEKILEVDLQETEGIAKKSLIIFRQATNEFRIVRTAIPEADVAPQPDEKIINVHAFRISPHFLLPYSSPSQSIHISGSYVHRGDFYDLKSFEDLLKVQHALTGYKVVHNATNVNWTTCHRGFFRTHQEVGSGTVQIWKGMLMPRIPSEAMDSIGQLSNLPVSLHNSQSSIMASTIAEEVTKRFSSGVATIRSRASDSGQVIAGTKPRDPVLVLLTRWQGNLAFLHLVLDDSIELKREPCQCTGSKHLCHEVVISAARKKFLVRRHIAEKDSNGNDILPSWNLAILGLPRHPEFKQLEKMDDVVWLNLRFLGPESREAFEEAFQTAVRVRRLEKVEFQQLSLALEWRSHKQGSKIASDRSSFTLTARSTYTRPQNDTENLAMA